MKKVILLSVVFFFIGITTTFAENEKVSKIVLSCNMDCGSCAAKIKKELTYTKGVKMVETDFEKDIITIEYRNDKTDSEKLIAAISKAGFKAEPQKANTCGAKKSCCSKKCGSK